jgi:glutaredoxin 2
MKLETKFKVINNDSKRVYDVEEENGDYFLSIRGHLGRYRYLKDDLESYIKSGKWSMVNEPNTTYENDYIEPLQFDDESKVDRHLFICQSLNDVYQKKNADYGDSFGEQFREYGEISAAIRLEDKLKRFKQLIKNPAQVKDESKIDTLLDMANYAIMTVIELQEK